MCNKADKLGIDLVANPDLMLDPAISAQVLISGMVDGDFTSKRLNDYIDKAGFDFVGARRIINGTDRASEVASYAAHFLDALDAAQLVESPAQVALNTHDSPPDEVVTDTDTGESINVWHDGPESPAVYNTDSPSVDDVYTPPRQATDTHYQPPAIHQNPGVLNRTRNKVSGWKTHIGMGISMLIGVAGMLGYIPGMSADTGAQMVQGAFGVSGIRSAIPKLIKMGIEFYLLNKTTRQ